MSIRVGIFATALVAVLVLAGPAQAANPLSPVQEWTQQSPANSPQARFSASMVFDPANGETVLFGGFLGGPLGDTWTWDGNNWTQEFPANAPPPRNAASMAFDPNTGTVLLFGGIGMGGFLNGTWSWDGSDWTQLSTATTPPARAAASMAFDASSGQIVMFGGTGGVLRNDTWTWDGSDWTQQSPATSPSVRQSGQMAFDPSTGELLMFGGVDTNGSIDETWIWTGSNWVEESPQNVPAVEGGRGIAFDPLSSDLVLFGASETNLGASESWSWDGSNWTQIATTQSPLPVNGPGMTFDASSGNIVLFGGQAGSSNNQTWTFGPPAGLESKWFEQSPATTPPALNSAGSTFDQSTGTTVLFGGYSDSGFLNETWNWDGNTWSEANPATSPSARYYVDPGFDFDPTEGDAVLFAGNDTTQPNTLRNDTWTWSGTEWNELSPPVSPSLRSQTALAFDPSMGKMLLFGGSNSQINLDETWTWDGSVWTQLNPPNSPPGRSGAGMVFDQSTGNMVMFGGGNENDTWTWDGTTWTEMSPATSPSPRAHPKMDFDPTSGDVVLYGGYFNGEVLADTWIWDGTNWTERTAPGGPGVRSFPNMNFDANSSGMLLYGGYDGTSFLDETWTYELIADPPSAEISSPADGATFILDEAVATSFTCSAGAGGPAVDTCLDSNGDPPPTGELDTSVLGSHTYSVTATSENGQTGSDQISYEVVKADPVLTTANPVSAVVGEPISIEAELSGGYQAGGTLTFKTYDPALPSCSQPVVFSESVPVSGDGTYESPDYLTQAAGDYLWTVEYSGDASNEAITTPCNGPDSTSEVAKAQPTLIPAGSTSGDLGDPITNSVDLSGRFSTGFSPDIEISFAAYGPDDPDCSGSPAFTSYSGSAEGDGVFTSLAFTPDSAGTYNWVATYSGDMNNEPASTACGAPDSISTVTDVGPVCPAVIYPFKVSTFKPNRKALNRQVPGVRVRFNTGFDMDAVIKPSYRYKVNGKFRTANLKQRSIRINGSRRLLFGIPSGMAARLRKATGQVSRNKVTFRTEATLRIHGAGPECEQNTKGSLQTRISGVSKRTALRSRWLAD